MYVTITPTASGSLVAHGPCAEPVAVAEPAVCLVLCPRSAVSRATWHLNHPYEYAAASKDLAALPEQRPIAVTVAELNAPTVAVVVHPLTPKMLAVGPFTGPDRAEQWWYVSVNRSATGDAICHILPLNSPDAESDAGEAGRR